MAALGIDVETLAPEDGDETDGLGGGAPARGSSNAAVAQLFDEIGDMLEIQDDQPFRVNAYRMAARSIGRLDERLEDVFAEGRLRQIHGVGPALEAKIVEYLSTGRMEYHERLTKEFPPALATLLAVPHLGPSKARAIYEQLQVTTLPDLERAAREGTLLEVPGFGPKAVENLLSSLDRMKERTTRNLISTGWEIGQSVIEALQARANSGKVAVVGSVRRMEETIGNVDLLAADDGDSTRLLDALASLPNVVEVLRRDANARSISVLLYGGMEVRLTVVSPGAWGAGLVWHTGSKAHVDRLNELAARKGWRLTRHGLNREDTGQAVESADEAQVYERLGLPWIPPEIREDTGEIEAGLAGTLPTLVEIGDIRGDMHVHTNWTDGAHPLEDMAAAAKAKGYQYMALTDHSQSLTIARGLTPERLAEERRLVDRINRKLAPFTVLLGTEMDILRDGSLDFPDEVLASLDYVSASVHSGFRQSRDVMTARIIRAVQSPYVNVLNHPHGRIIRRREAYQVDMQAVIQAAVAAGTALELNAQPDRLDLDGTWARRARDAGARFTISSDAHSTRNLDLMPYGIGSARRGWLRREDVLNTLSLEELRAALSAKRRSAA